MSGQALILLSLYRLQGGIARDFFLFCGINRPIQCGEFAAVCGLFLFELVRCHTLCGDVLLQLVLLFELLPPDADALSQSRSLRVGDAEVVELLTLALCLL